MVQKIDIKFSAHDEFRESSSSGKSHCRKIGNSSNLTNFGNNKTKGPKEDSKNQLRSHMPAGGYPNL